MKIVNPGMPTLDEQAKIDINDTLARKLVYEPQGIIKYWENGYHKSLECEKNLIVSVTSYKF